MATYAFNINTLKATYGKNSIKITCDLHKRARAIVDVDSETKYEFMRVVKGSIVKLLHDKDNAYFAKNVSRIKFDVSGATAILEVKANEECIYDIQRVVEHIYFRLAFGMIQDKPQSLKLAENDDG